MKMNIRFMLAPALALLSCAGMYGQATKVALINMQEAIANTKEGQAQIAELDKKYGPKQQEFQKRAADIQAKTDQLKKTQNTISDDAKASLDAEITRMKTALQRDSDDAQADSDQDQQKMMQEVGAKVVQAVTKYSQDNQIMLVFDLSSQPNNLICCASAPDITREVIALTDKMSAGGAAPAAAKPATPAAPRPAAPTAPKPAGPAAPAK
jgi:outer membrane protein